MEAEAGVTRPLSRGHPDQLQMQGPSWEPLEGFDLGLPASRTVREPVSAAGRHQVHVHVVSLPWEVTASAQAEKTVHGMRP